MSQYITSDDLKKTLTMTGTTFADYDIAPAIIAASDAINELCGRKFDRDVSEDSTRYYRPSDGETVVIDDCISITSLFADLNSDGDFEEEYTLNQHYVLWPYNNLDDGRPYTQVQLQTYHFGTKAFPYWSRRSVKIVGKFGWPTDTFEELSAGFLQVATKKLAGRLIKSMREAPFGVVTVGLDVGSAMRVARQDSEVMGLCEPYTREKVLAA